MTATPGQGTLPADTQIGRTALRVGDLDSVVRFYTDVIGLTGIDHEPDKATLGVGESPLLVVTQVDASPERARTGAGLFHTAFRVPSRAALGAALSRITERWQLDGASDHGVSEALYLTDPEGNGVEVYHDRPRETWSVTDDGTVSMVTAPLELGAVASAAGTSADAHDPARVPPGTDIGHVHLEVTSLPAFESVYVDGIGFETGMTGPDVRFVGAGGYHHHIAANTWQRRTTPAAGRGLAWFEVLVPDQAATLAIRDRFDALDPDVDTALTERDDGLDVTDADGITVRIRIE